MLTKIIGNCLSALIKGIIYRLCLYNLLQFTADDDYEGGI